MSLRQGFKVAGNQGYRVVPGPMGDYARAKSQPVRAPAYLESPFK